MSTWARSSRLVEPVTRAERSVAVGLLELAALERLLEATGHGGAHAVDLLGAPGDVGDVEARLGEDLDDARRHRARPDDTDPAYLTLELWLGAGVRRLLVVEDDRAVVGLVGVEPTPGLAAEEPGGRHLLEDRARCVEPVAALLVHRVEDLVRRVESDQVEQRERTHRVATAETHRRVDVLAGGVVGFVHGHGVVEVAEEQGVGDEAGLVADRDRVLVQLAGQVLHLVDDVGLGDDGADHLAELLDRCRVEEVHADDPAGVGGRGRDLRDGQARRVGGEHGVRADDLVELLEDRALEVEVLHDGLDHEVAVLEVGERGAQGEPVEDRLLLVLAELAPLLGAVGGVLDVGAAAVQLLVGLLDADDGEPVPGEDLGDAGAHRAQADDTDRGELSGHGLDPPISQAPPEHEVPHARSVGSRS